MNKKLALVTSARMDQFEKELQLKKAEFGYKTTMLQVQMDKIKIDAELTKVQISKMKSNLKMIMLERIVKI